MALSKVRTKGTGIAGSKSGRWTTRADAKQSARKHRRAEDRSSKDKGSAE